MSYGHLPAVGSAAFDPKTRGVTPRKSEGGAAIPKKTPDYRQRKDSEQAIVTLMDAVTHERRDYWLGTFGTPESRELYHRLIAEWEAKGRVLPERHAGAAPGAGGMTVEEVLAQYWMWAKTHYTRRASRSRSAPRPVTSWMPSSHT